MRILLLSDIHANLVALNEVIAQAGAFDRIWCLGDVVGYGPEPNACIETLRRYDTVCIAGNHDWAVLGRLDLEEFNPDARRAALWTRSQLTVNNLDWLHTLPEGPLQVDAWTLVHGSPRHPIWEYVLTPAVARINFEYISKPVCFIGHTHVPVVFRYHSDTDTATAEPLVENDALTFGPERMMINPGSVGQPRDGDNRAAFALVDTQHGTLTYRRVSYAIGATQARMEQAGLPIRLSARLNYGW